MLNDHATQLPAMALEPGLSDAQIDDFGRRGFLVEDDVFTADEIDVLRAAVDASFDIDGRDRARGADEVVHILEITAMHPAFALAARAPRLLSKVAALIGPAIQLHHSKLCAQPHQAGRGGLIWHQDFSFNPHTNSDMVTVMIMLDDTDLDNGCMVMIEGSHLDGPRSHTRDGYHQVGCVGEERNADLAGHPPIVVRAGGISIHHCLTLHASGKNHDGRPRRGLAFHYRAADAYQLAGEVFADTGWQLLGEPTRHVRCTLDSIELPRRASWRTTYGNEFGPAAMQRGANVDQLEQLGAQDDLVSAAHILNGLKRDDRAGAF